MCDKEIQRYHRNNYPIFDAWFRIYNYPNDPFLDFLRKENTAKSWTALSYYVDNWEKKYCFHRALERDPNYIPALIEFVRHSYKYEVICHEQLLKHCKKIIESKQYTDENPLIYYIMERLYDRMNDKINRDRITIRNAVHKDSLRLINEITNSMESIERIFSDFQALGLEGITQLVKEVQRLRRENFELSHVPGAQEYYEAQKRFNSLKNENI